MSIRSCLVSQLKDKLFSNNEQLFIATDSSPITFGIIFSLNLHSKHSIISQINPGTLDKNKNSKARTIKMLLDSGASASIIHIERHLIMYDKKNKWSTMVRNFNKTFVMKLKLKTPKLNYSAEINTKYHLTDTLLNYNLILGRDILHEVGKIFHFKNKTVT